MLTNIKFLQDILQITNCNERNIVNQSQCMDEIKEFLSISHKDINSIYVIKDIQIINCLQQLSNKYHNLFGELNMQDMQESILQTHELLKSFQSFVDILVLIFNILQENFLVSIKGNECLSLLQNLSNSYWLFEDYIQPANKLSIKITGSKRFSHTYELYYDITKSMRKLYSSIGHIFQTTSIISHNSRLSFEELLIKEGSRNVFKFYFRALSNFGAGSKHSEKFKVGYNSPTKSKEIHEMQSQMLDILQNLILNLTAFSSSHSTNYAHYFVEFFKYTQNTLKDDSIKDFNNTNLKPKHIDSFMKIMQELVHTSTTTDEDHVGNETFLPYVRNIFPHLLRMAHACPDPRALLGLLYLNDTLCGRPVKAEFIDGWYALSQILAATDGPALTSCLTRSTPAREIGSGPRAKMVAPTAEPLLLDLYHEWLSSHLADLTKLCRRKPCLLDSQLANVLLCIRAFLPLSEPAFRTNYFRLFTAYLVSGSGPGSLAKFGGNSSLVRNAVDDITSLGWSTFARQRSMGTALPALLEILVGASVQTCSGLFGPQSLETLAHVVENLPYRTLLDNMATCLTYVKREPSNLSYARIFSTYLRHFPLDKSAFPATLKSTMLGLLNETIEWLEEISERIELSPIVHSNVCMIAYQVSCLVRLLTYYQIPHLTPEDNPCQVERCLRIINRLRESPLLRDLPMTPIHDDSLHPSDLEHILFHVRFANFALVIDIEEITSRPNKKKYKERSSGCLADAMKRVATAISSCTAHIDQLFQGTTTISEISFRTTICDHMADLKTLVGSVSGLEGWVGAGGALKNLYVAISGHLVGISNVSPISCLPTLTELIRQTIVQDPELTYYLTLQGFKSIFDRSTSGPVPHHDGLVACGITDASSMTSSISLRLSSELGDAGGYTSTEPDTVDRFILDYLDDIGTKFMSEEGAEKDDATAFDTKYCALVPMLTILTRLPNNLPPNKTLLPLISTSVLAGLRLQHHHSSKVGSELTDQEGMINPPKNQSEHMSDQISTVPFDILFQLFHKYGPAPGALDPWSTPNTVAVPSSVLVSLYFASRTNTEGSATHFPNLVTWLMSNVISGSRDVDLGGRTSCKLGRRFLRYPIVSVELVGYLYVLAINQSTAFTHPRNGQLLSFIADGIDELIHSVSLKDMAHASPQLTSSIYRLALMKMGMVRNFSRTTQRSDTELEKLLEAIHNTTTNGIFGYPTKGDALLALNYTLAKASSSNKRLSRTEKIIVSQQPAKKRLKPSASITPCGDFSTLPTVLSLLGSILDKASNDETDATAIMSAICHVTSVGGRTPVALSHSLTTGILTLTTWLVAHAPDRTNDYSVTLRQLNDNLVCHVDNRDGLDDTILSKFCITFLIYGSMYQTLSKDSQGISQVSSDNKKGNPTSPNTLDFIYKYVVKVLDMWANYSTTILPTLSECSKVRKIFVICLLAHQELLRTIFKYTNKFGETFCTAVTSFTTTIKPLLPILLPARSSPSSFGETGDLSPRRSYNNTTAPSDLSPSSTALTFDGSAYGALLRAHLSLWTYCVMKKPKTMLTSSDPSRIPKPYGPQFTVLSECIGLLARELARASKSLPGMVAGGTEETAAISVCLEPATALAKLTNTVSRAFREHHSHPGVSGSRYHVLPHTFATVLHAVASIGNREASTATTSIIPTLTCRILRGALMDLISNLDKSGLLYLRAILNTNSGSGFDRRSNNNGRQTTDFSITSYFNTLYAEYLSDHKYTGKN